MNGFIKKTLAALSLAGGLSVFAGCYSTCQEKYYNCVDPCWPQRYTAMAAESVSGGFAPQVENGHVLDQTIWNDYFDKGTAVLTPAGLDHLSYLARRRPAADPHIFLQTSYDLPTAYDPANPTKFATDRSKLDQERRVAILDFLHSQTTGRPGAPGFVVDIHDPGPVGMHSVPMLKSVAEFHGSFKGQMPMGFGMTSGGGGGGGGGGGR